MRPTKRSARRRGRRCETAPKEKRPRPKRRGRIVSVAEMHANRTHPRRSARLTAALKAAGPTRAHPSPCWKGHRISMPVHDNASPGEMPRLSAAALGMPALRQRASPAPRCLGRSQSSCGAALVISSFPAARRQDDGAQPWPAIEGPQAAWAACRPCDGRGRSV